MTDTERAEYRQAITELRRQAEHYRTLCESLDWAKVRVLLADGTDHTIRLDELVAHAYGGPRPKLTAGAQAILAIDAQERRQ